MTTINTSTLYRITATTEGSVSANQAEVLGEAYGRLYTDRAAAESDAEDMQDEIAEYGLDASTVYAVEDLDVTVEVGDVSVVLDDNNTGEHLVSAVLYIGDSEIRGTWSARVSDGQLVPAGDAIDCWSDATVLARHGAQIANVLGLGVLDAVTPDQIVDAVSEAA